MKRVQNWRDYLDDDTSNPFKQKTPKKVKDPNKSEKDEEEFNKRTDKKRSKRK